MPKLHTWPDYIIRKGFFLSGTLLICALVLSVWADACPISALTLRHYIACSQTSSLLVLIASLFGGLFLEDILRKTQ